MKSTLLAPRSAPPHELRRRADQQFLHGTEQQLRHAGGARGERFDQRDGQRLDVRDLFTAFVQLQHGAAWDLRRPSRQPELNSTGTMPANSMGTLCLTSFAFSPSAVIAGDASKRRPGRSISRASPRASAPSFPAIPSPSGVVPGRGHLDGHAEDHVELHERCRGGVRTAAAELRERHVPIRERRRTAAGIATETTPRPRPRLQVHGSAQHASRSSGFPPASCVGSFPQVRVTAVRRCEHPLSPRVQQRLLCRAQQLDGYHQQCAGRPHRRVDRSRAPNN